MRSPECIPERLAAMSSEKTRAAETLVSLHGICFVSVLFLVSSGDTPIILAASMQRVREMYLVFKKCSGFVLDGPISKFLTYYVRLVVRGQTSTDLSFRVHMPSPVTFYRVPARHYAKQSSFCR